MERRQFLAQATLAGTGMALGTGLPSLVSASSHENEPMSLSTPKETKRFRPKDKAGFGGVALGNGFQQNPDRECLEAVEAAWDAGIRLYDTSHGMA